MQPGKSVVNFKTVGNKNEKIFWAVTQVAKNDNS